MGKFKKIGIGIGIIIVLVSIVIQFGLESKVYKNVERICQACNEGRHESHSSDIWFDGDVSHCKCSKCVEVKKGVRVKTEVFE